MVEESIMDRLRHSVVTAVISVHPAEEMFHLHHPAERSLASGLCR